MASLRRRSAAAAGRTLGSSSSPSERRRAVAATLVPVAARVLWDVDTQVDFVHPDGKLSVPGATAAVPAMARVVEAARAAGIPHVASADDHELTDDEISATPDYSMT